MKLVVGILGVTVGLIVGFVTFMVGGAFGYTMAKEKMSEEQQETENEED